MLRIDFYLVLAITFLFHACSNARIENSDTKTYSTTLSNSANTKKLRIMGQWYKDGKKEMFLRKCVRAFSLLNQDLDVSFQFPEEIYNDGSNDLTYAKNLDSIIGMTKTGQWPWDVLKVDAYSYEAISEKLNDHAWGKKYLVDLSQKQWFKEVHKDGIFADSILYHKYGNMMPGTAIEGITDILWVSDKVEQNLGITVKSRNMTASDFVQYAKSVFEYNKTHDKKLTFLSLQNSESFPMLFTQLALSVFQHSKSGNIELAKESLNKAYTVFEELSAYNVLAQYYDYTHVNVPNEARYKVLFADECLFSLSANWLTIFWDKEFNDGFKHMRPCEIPCIENGQAPFYQGIYQIVFVIPQNAANTKGAERFLKFMSSAQIADQWVNDSKSFTGLKNGISASDFGKDKMDIFYRYIQKKYNNRFEHTKLAKQIFNADKDIDFCINDVLAGKITSAEVLKNVMQQIR